MGVSAISAVRTEVDAVRPPVTADPAPEPADPAPEPAGRAERAEQAAPGRAAHRPARTAHDAPADPQAVFATSQYLQQLLAAQVLGGATTHLARPARITPERLSALVDYLESHASGAPADPAGAVLDTAG